MMFETSQLLFLLMALGAVSATGQEESNEAYLERWKNGQTLSQGDLTSLHQAYERRDLQALWAAFHGTSHGYGRNSAQTAELGYTSDQQEELERRVKAYAGKLLSQIPGHAKLLGDEIERLSEVPDFRSYENNQRRQVLLEKLAELGSLEAIQQIGRFVLDERGKMTHEQIANSERASAEARERSEKMGGIDISPSSNPQPNWMAAIPALDRAIRGIIPMGDSRWAPGRVNWGPDEYKRAREWWKSEASAAYKKPLVQTEPPPEPLPARIDVRGFKAPPRQRPAPPAEVSQPPKPRAEETPRWNIWVTVGGIALTAALLVWLSSRGRKR